VGKANKSEMKEWNPHELLLEEASHRRGWSFGRILSGFHHTTVSRLSVYVDSQTREWKETPVLLLLHAIYVFFSSFPSPCSSIACWRNSVLFYQSLVRILRNIRFIYLPYSLSGHIEPI